MKWIATLALAAVTVGLATAVCPDGFEDLDDSSTSEVCIRFLKIATSWTGIRQFCQELGADLVKVSGRMHGLLVERITSDAELQDHIFWTSGTDAGYEGNWKWTTDNSEIPLGVPHWYPCDEGNPNGGLKENYLALYPPEYYFHDAPHSISAYGICQYIQPAAAPTKP